MSRYSLASRTVFITDAAGGIGGAAARVLHERHANVVLCDLHPSAVEDQAARLGSDRAVGIGVDVTRPDQLDAAAPRRWSASAASMWCSPTRASPSIRQPRSPASTRSRSSG